MGSCPSKSGPAATEAPSIGVKNDADYISKLSYECCIIIIIILLH